MPDLDEFAADLRRVAPHCHWTCGTWAFGMRWDEIQVVPGHITTLTDFLLAAYRRETTPPARRRATRPAKQAA
jgi:hypothetical protein